MGCRQSLPNRTGSAKITTLHNRSGETIIVQPILQGQLATTSISIASEESSAMRRSGADCFASYQVRDSRDNFTGILFTTTDLQKSKEISIVKNAGSFVREFTPR